ncbi:hypothetical protein APASM_0025 [Actinosynnema pretiosum subsp. pretiosum]|nr:hypothetical protein APASM_0025 [Actinosynnema pretiosum subsp. pretiosum]
MTSTAPKARRKSSVLRLVGGGFNPGDVPLALASGVSSAPVPGEPIGY